MTARKKASPARGARILAYLDPEARNASLFDLLVRLARRRQADVLLLRALPRLPWYVRGRRAQEIRQALERDALAGLERDMKSLRGAGLRVRTRLAWGRPFEVIIREALRRPTALVTMTARGEGRRQSLFFGSTAMHLFRSCPVPVWVVKPGRPGRIRRVMAAVDPIEPTADEVDLNREILRFAREIAADERAELHVCHAFWILSERVLPEQSRAFVREFAARVRRVMGELLSPFGLSPDDRCVHIVDGDPGEVIPALAARERIDLLVMGTIARAGVPGLLIGNTAERTLRAVDCSVLAIKPEGFVSPLELGGRPRSA